MRSRALLVVSLALPIPCWPAVARAVQDPALIPRRVLFGNPERTGPLISPDGQTLAYLAPDSGVLNVWVRTIGSTDDRPVTRDRARPVRFFFWQGDSKHVLYLQDKAGDENYHVLQTDVATRGTRDLTPFDSVTAQILAVDPSRPNELVVALNRRDRRFHDAFRLNLASGALTLLVENPGDVAGYSADNAFRVRVAQASLPDGGNEIRVRDDSNHWKTIRHEGPDETFGGVAAFTPDDQAVWLISSVDANAARLVQLDLKSGTSRVIAADSQFDVNGILTHPRTHALQAVSFDRLRLEWQVVDPAIRADFQALGRVRDGDFTVDSRSLDDRRWIVRYVVSDGPIYFYLYDRGTRHATLLFSNRPKLEQYSLVKMQPVTFPARDGMRLYGYLTLPPGKAPQDLPLVLFPHGGPWGRDDWGYNPFVQWLANRGYGVLQVNFRGSTGYGKKYLNAGDREWAGKMQTDLLDGLDWAVQQGYVDRRRVCIFGGSYGGYATLIGVAFTPDLFACGIDLFGPSNLVTLMESIPPYWTTFRAVFDKRMGRLDEPDFLRSRSPLFKADQIRAPLLIIQGANDVRVKQPESDQIVAAMRKNGRDVVYIVFPDEGHGFARPENNLIFTAAAEAFLAKYLGGRSEPEGNGESATAFLK